MRPNLFHFATSELSQDAVLSWLLAWADGDAAAHDAALHAVGRAFLERLFKAFKADCPPGPLAVRPVRQLDDADIVALVGERHVVVIEDKTGTQDHSDQLRRYEAAVRVRYPDRSPVLVYVKTGDQASYEEVRRKGWAVLTRSELLEVLGTSRASVRNNVFVDFLEHLERNEAAVQSFRTTPPSAWGRCGPPWTGFYEQVLRSLGTGGWGYVPNANGGFMGLWWGWCPVPGGQLYLQLEEEILCVKVKPAGETDRRTIRDRWCRLVVGDRGDLRYRRPQRLGNGKYMTVARLEGEYRVARADGCLDVDATLAILRAATADLVAIAASQPTTASA